MVQAPWECLQHMIREELRKYALRHLEVGAWREHGGKPGTPRGILNGLEESAFAWRIPLWI